MNCYCIMYVQDSPFKERLRTHIQENTDAPNWNAFSRSLRVVDYTTQIVRVELWKQKMFRDKLVGVTGVCCVVCCVLCVVCCVLCVVCCVLCVVCCVLCVVCCDFAVELTSNACQQITIPEISMSNLGDEELGEVETELDHEGHVSGRVHLTIRLERRRVHANP